jgi:hypothetical protein
MANPTGAYGFLPVGNVNGGPYNGETIRVYSPTTLTTAIFVGDVVEYTGAGSSDGYATVTPTAATDAPWGVITGIEAIKTNLEANNYKPGTTEAYMRMVPVDGNLFKVRLNGTTTANEALIGATTIYVVAAERPRQMKRLLGQLQFMWLPQAQLLRVIPASCYLQLMLAHPQQTRFAS